MVNSITLMIPYYNYTLEPFELSIESIHNQIVPFDEVVIADFGSDDPYQSKMENLCNDNGFKYVYTEVDAIPSVKGVHLWMLGCNIGLRHSTKDLILSGGTDRIYKDNTVRSVYEHYNKAKEKFKEAMLICGGWNIDTFDVESLRGKTFEELKSLARWRGGQAFWVAPKDWWYKVQGMDETLRWYADWDIIRRMKLDGGVPVRIHKPSRLPVSELTTCLHIHNHGKSRKLYDEGESIREAARAGKRAIHRHTGYTDVIRNDENWGILTEKKLERAKWKASLTNEEIKKLIEEKKSPWQRY